MWLGALAGIGAVRLGRQALVEADRFGRTHREQSGPDW